MTMTGLLVSSTDPWANGARVSGGLYIMMGAVDIMTWCSCVIHFGDVGGPRAIRQGRVVLCKEDVRHTPYTVCTLPNVMAVTLV